MVSAGKTEYNIKVEILEEYVKLLELDPENTKHIAVPWPLFERGLSHTIFTCSKDDIRPVMMGINMKVSENSICFAASDTHVLMKHETFMNFSEKIECILPARAMDILMKITKGDHLNLSLKVDGKYIEISAGLNVFIVRLIEGNYPNYEAIIPTDNNFSGKVLASDLLNALTKVRPFTCTATDRVELRFKENELDLLTEDLDYEKSAKTSINCTYSDTDIAIGIKIKFLLEIMKNVKAQEYIIKLKDPSRAILMEPIGAPKIVFAEEKIELTILVMPMLLS
jgi:DNA polymerase-3 subunit beta